MKFSAITKGTRARKAVPFPLGDGPLPLPEVGEDGKVFYPNDGQFVLVDVRVLTTDEEMAALAAARSAAVKEGVTDPKEGDPVYDLAVMVHFVAASCLDHDSPEDKPAPFFDGGVAQVRSLDRDRLVLLYEQQAAFQAEVSPRRLTLTPEEYVGYITALAVADGDAPFSDVLPLATQRNLLRFTAKLLHDSQTLKSPSTSA